MFWKAPVGLFITGNNTGVGKTYVACRIAEQLRRQGKTVGAYKPAASGAIQQAGELISEDAQALWEATGKNWPIERICPQIFAAPLAPHLAARAEGKEIDSKLLIDGLKFWQDEQCQGRCDLILVEGAGGLMSPLADDRLVIDLAREFNFPLIVVAANRLGMINETLLTLHAASSGPRVAGIVINDVGDDPDDISRTSNPRALADWTLVPVLAHLQSNGAAFPEATDWIQLVKSAP